MEFKLLPIKPFMPPYESPARAQPPPKPELMNSPNYSPARPVPNALLKPSPRKNGLNMRGKGGTYKYQAPEAIDQAAIRNTLNEEARERAQSSRSKLIFNPNFINKWEKGDPLAHQKLANLGRAAAGEPSLKPLPFPPPPPVKVPRVKAILFNNNNNNNNSKVAAPNTRKRKFNNNNNNNNNTNRQGKKSKTRRLKNRRHK